MPRLLLVDDNPSIHKIVASLLGPTAVKVSHANDAEEALKIVDSGAIFDVALVDTTLPKADGWELLGWLRSDPRSASWPIAMMAGVLEDVDLARVEREPIQAFFRKPVDLRDLADKVTALMALPYKPSSASRQLAESAPSDLLILEAQDLFQEIYPAEPGGTAIDASDAAAYGATAPLEEDAVLAEPDGAAAEATGPTEEGMTPAEPSEAAVDAAAFEATAPPEEDIISVDAEDAVFDAAAFEATEPPEEDIILVEPDNAALDAAAFEVTEPPEEDAIPAEPSDAAAYEMTVPPEEDIILVEPDGAALDAAAFEATAPPEEDIILAEAGEAAIGAADAAAYEAPPPEEDAIPAEPSGVAADAAAAAYEAAAPPEEDIILVEPSDMAIDAAAYGAEPPPEEDAIPAEPSDMAVDAAADAGSFKAIVLQEGEEDAISIELEDLDLSKIDQLVASGDEEIGLAEDEPDKDKAIFLDTAPGDFGPELLSAGGLRHSPLASELLSDQEFIRAVAKEVAKNMALRGIDV